VKSTIDNRPAQTPGSCSRKLNHESFPPVSISILIFFASNTARTCTVKMFCWSKQIFSYMYRYIIFLKKIKKKPQVCVYFPYIHKKLLHKLKKNRYIDNIIQVVILLIFYYKLSLSSIKKMHVLKKKWNKIFKLRQLQKEYIFSCNI